MCTLNNAPRCQKTFKVCEFQPEGYMQVEFINISESNVPLGFLIVRPSLHGSQKPRKGRPSNFIDSKILSYCTSQIGFKMMQKKRCIRVYQCFCIQPFSGIFSAQAKDILEEPLLMRFRMGMKVGSCTSCY